MISNPRWNHQPRSWDRTKGGGGNRCKVLSDVEKGEQTEELAAKTNISEKDALSKLLREIKRLLRRP